MVRVLKPGNVQTGAKVPHSKMVTAGWYLAGPTKLIIWLAKQLQ